MTEILSQDEIDQLLASIKSIDTTFEKEKERSDVNLTDTVVQKKIHLYDFRHPDRFSKEQLRTIEIMHETFARLVTNNLSTQLRTLVSVQIASVSQITYEEFVKSVANPTLFAVVDMRPLTGSAMIEISPSVTFTIMEILFGGEGDSVFNRELTEIEQSVAENIIEKMLEYFKETWKRIVNLRPHLLNIETNPNLVQVVPPSEMMLLIICNCKINNVVGIINIAIPYITIEQVVSKLSAQTWYAVDIYGDSDDQVKKKLSKSMTGIEADLTAVVGKVNLSINEILSLKSGDVVMLDNAKFSDPISLFIGNVKKFSVIPGKKANRLAVKIIDQITDQLQNDDDSLEDPFQGNR